MCDNMGLDWHACAIMVCVVVVMFAYLALSIVCPVLGAVMSVCLLGAATYQWYVWEQEYNGGRDLQYLPRVSALAPKELL